MGELDDAIKFEDELKKMAGLMAAAHAKHLDHAIMAGSMARKLENERVEQEKLLGHPVYTSEHMPNDGIVIFSRPQVRFGPIKIDWEDRDNHRITTGVRFGWPYTNLDSLTFWDDYVSLVDRLEIKLFNWPRYLALSLLVLSLIVIMLLVAR